MAVLYDQRVTQSLGDFLADGTLAAVDQAVEEIITRATKEAQRAGKRLKLAVSCTRCTEPACCSSVVLARFYEGVRIAARLRAQRRDSPELRARLAELAAAMEAATPRAWRQPCVFLDPRGRCSIYDVRPTACGTLYVYSPPAMCSDRDGKVDAFIAHEETAAAASLEEPFRERLALRKKVGRRYLGVLPRMVWLALEAWDRPDFREYLRAYDWPTDEQIASWESPTG